MNATGYIKQTLPPFNNRRLVAASCPCGKSNKDGKFAPFKGFTDKGYCHSCGETFLPELKKESFPKNDRFLFPRTKGEETRKRPEPVSYLPFDLLEKTLAGYEKNHFATYLIALFGEIVAYDLIDSFFIGTARKPEGATVFPQIDVNANFRQAKVILYDPATGNRRKDITPFQIAKKMLGEDANVQSCFFNEVGLTLYPQKPVAICESEKSAILASMFIPSFVWLATGGKNGVKWTDYEVCKVLKGRTVLLYPDIQAYDKWLQDAEEIRKKVACKIVVSDLLEKNATPEQRERKLDIADFLINRCTQTGLALSTTGYPAAWDYTIENC
jgi:hypothetical protein